MYIFTSFTYSFFFVIISRYYNMYRNEYLSELYTLPIIKNPFQLKTLGDIL